MLLVLAFLLSPEWLASVLCFSIIMTKWPSTLRAVTPRSFPRNIGSVAIALVAAEL